MKTIYPNCKIYKSVLAPAITCVVLFVYTGKVQAQTYTKSGTVYEDYNGNASLNAGEPGTNADGKLYAYLVNNKSNSVLQSQAIAADGTYSFSGLPALSGANYIIGIGSGGLTTGTIPGDGTEGYNRYFIFPSTWSLVKPEAKRWKDVGNGTDDTGNNFFIRRLPVSTNNVQAQMPGCSSTGCIGIQGLSGSPATGNVSYTINKYKILTIPQGGTLKTGTTRITAGQTISASAAANLCFAKSAGAVGTSSFTYVAVNDIGGNEYISPVTATYTLRLGGVDFRRDAASAILLTCNSQSTTLFAPFTSDTTGLTITYNWTGPDNFSSTLKSPILAANTPVEDGLYIVTATDQNGCLSKDTLKTKRMTCFTACDGDNGYMVKGSGSTNADYLYKYNVPTGTTTIVSSSLTSIDAVCYNIYNNLIYGWAEGGSPAKHIYAVDAVGKQVDLGVTADASLFSTYYYAGTCAPDGKWYMSTGSGDPNFLVLDINPSSATYMRYAGKITASGGTFDPWDFTWSDCDQMIYGVAGNDLYQMNPTTGVITKFPVNVPGGNGFYGAQFLDYNCNLYISQSSNGNVYKTSLGNPIDSPIEFIPYSPGPVGYFNDATISPIKPKDFGDAPASYGVCYHRFNCAGGPGSELLYLGNKIDYETDPLYSNDALYDDNKSTGLNDGSDEDGLVSYSTLLPCVGNGPFSVVLNTYNHTGSGAVLSGWIDFNNNGIFELSERQQAAIADNQAIATLKWTGTIASLPPGSSIFARFRIGTGTQVDDPAGGASLGEVEDYRIQVMGIDHGDAPYTPYGNAYSYVYADTNGDNIPDNPSAIWLGHLAQGKDGNNGCPAAENTYATGDDNDGIDDEDGYVVPNVFQAGPATIDFIANGNTHGQVGYYGIWIDWNRDGFTNNADEFYSGSFSVGSPVTVRQPINVPLKMSATSLVYMRFRVATRPLVYSDYSNDLINSETEDYFLNNAVLPVTLTGFTAEKECHDAVLLKWQTSSEQNNRGFNILHGTDGRSWQTISFVPGAGTSNKPADYKYVHDGLSSGFHYYHLQQVDLDNNINTSAVRKINLEDVSGETVRVYPNPTKDKLYVEQTASCTHLHVRVYNTSGKMVLGKTTLKNGDALDVQQLPPGIYILKLDYPDKASAYKKIVKE